MRYIKSISTIFIALSLVVMLVLPSWAGITGKIRGVVRDVDTGDPLPGVNVVVNMVWVQGIEKEFGGQLGAATDLNGEYIILKVPPGIYSITASMIGYSKSVRTHVKVHIDRTTTLNFNLKETVLDIGGEIVVEAKRDLVHLDVAATDTYISTEDYQATPLPTVLRTSSPYSQVYQETLMKARLKSEKGKRERWDFYWMGWIWSIENSIVRLSLFNQALFKKSNSCEMVLTPNTDNLDRVS